MVSESDEKADSIKEQLTKIEEEWGKAVQRRDIENDVATVHSILADDWRGITARGEIRTKDDHIGQIRARNVAIESVDLYDMDVRVYGDFAVVTGGELRRGTCGGTDMTGSSMWTDVFIKAGDVWQIVASQSTMVHPEPIGRFWESGEA